MKKLKMRETGEDLGGFNQKGEKSKKLGCDFVELGFWGLPRRVLLQLRVEF